MNKLIIRFIIVKAKKEIEVVLDSRLSFKENFNLLKNISSDFDVKEFHIMSENSSLLLDKEAPIKEFEMADFTRLYLL